MKNCDHSKVEGFAMEHFTVCVCQECGMRDVRSGEDELNHGEDAWSLDRDADELLSRYIVPIERTPQFSWWVFGEAEFRALPAEVRELFSRAGGCRQLGCVTDLTY